MVSINSGSNKHYNREQRIVLLGLLLVFFLMSLTPRQGEEQFYLLADTVEVGEETNNISMKHNIGQPSTNNLPNANSIAASTREKAMTDPSRGALVPVKRKDHRLPPWMIEYFDWHQKEKTKIKSENWESGRFRFLIMRCLHADNICGGTSDRLQSIPYQLLMASLSKRILLIYWERPFPLEEFLLPPKGGLDWRVPAFMAETLVQKYNEAPLSYAPTAKKRLLTPDYEKKLVVWARDQTHNHGKAAYDEHHELADESSRFEAVFHDAWRMVFTPSPPVARQTEYWMTKLGLVPGHYASTHVRALYGVHNRSREQIEEWTQNALHCTTELLPQGPFFFASDSTDAQRAALEYGEKAGLQVVSRFHDSEPLHMDGNSTGKKPEDYYDVLVDLYLLGNARALAYNVGGYGKLGLILGFNHTAGMQHQKGGVPWAKGITGVSLNKCRLKRPQDTETNREVAPLPSSGSFFAKPV